MSPMVTPSDNTLKQIYFFVPSPSLCKKIPPLSPGLASSLLILCFIAIDKMVATYRLIVVSFFTFPLHRLIIIIFPG